jgi:rare lipoprotein A
VASYYARKFNGRKTASGERYDMHDLTAAHPTLPFDTRVRVTNLSNNLSVVVRVNDRGPFKKSRIIDISYAAAVKIGLIVKGTAKVRVEVVK